MEIEVAIFFLWIALSIVSGIIGSSREIGGAVFLLSIFLSPLVGLLIAFNSRKKAVVEYERESLENQIKMIVLIEKLYEQTRMNTINHDDL